MTTSNNEITTSNNGITTSNNEITTSNNGITTGNNGITTGNNGITTGNNEANLSPVESVDTSADTAMTMAFRKIKQPKKPRGQVKVSRGLIGFVERYDLTLTLTLTLILFGVFGDASAIRFHSTVECA